MLKSLHTVKLRSQPSENWTSSRCGQNIWTWAAILALESFVDSVRPLHSTYFDQTETISLFNQSLLCNLKISLTNAYLYSIKFTYKSLYFSDGADFSYISSMLFQVADLQEIVRASLSPICASISFDGLTYRRIFKLLVSLKASECCRIH
jgi:hypothetical protein